MTHPRLALVLATGAFAASLPATAADIVLTPPAAGGVAVTNAAGNATRLRVADDGVITLPGLGALPVAGTGLCIDAATGRLGTCALPGGGASGTVTSVVAGTGLTGGTITTSGTIAADTNFLQRRVSASCAVGSSIRAIAADGTVTCQADTSGSPNAFVLGGNAFGASAALGTSDAFPLHLVQAGVPALRLFTPTGATGPSLVAGHPSNSANVAFATIAGGGALVAASGVEPVTGLACRVGSNCSNEVAAVGGTVGGGFDNKITAGRLNTIAGGTRNRASGDFGAIGGGYENTVSESGGVIAGGEQNQATARAAAVSGGISNRATGPTSTVTGGIFNSAFGDSATVLGGQFNVARGQSAIAAGVGADATHDHSFVWAGRPAAGAVAFPSSQAGEFAALAPGGVRFVTAIDEFGNYLQTVSIDTEGRLGFGNTTRQMLNLYSASYGIGVQPDTMYFRSNSHYAWYAGGSHSDTALSSGLPFNGGVLMTLTNGTPSGLPSVTGLARAQSFVSTSDREAKEAFQPVDERGVLEALVAMPVNTWSYRTEGEEIRHIGPTAQDFRAAFGVGYDERTIATVDADGVALAAIKGLAQVVAEKDRRIAELEAKARELEATAARVEALEREWTALKARLR